MPDPGMLEMVFPLTCVLRSNESPKFIPPDVGFRMTLFCMKRPSALVPAPPMAVPRKAIFSVPASRVSFRPMSTRVLLETVTFLNRDPCGENSAMPLVSVFSNVLPVIDMFSRGAALKYLPTVITPLLVGTRFSVLDGCTMSRNVTPSMAAPLWSMMKSTFPVIVAGPLIFMPLPITMEASLFPSKAYVRSDSFRVAPLAMFATKVGVRSSFGVMTRIGRVVTTT